MCEVDGLPVAPNLHTDWSSLPRFEWATIDRSGEAVATLYCCRYNQKPPRALLVLFWVRAARDRTQSYQMKLVDSPLDSDASPG